jgi:hypothetical protein
VSSLPEVRAGLADRLRTISGLRVLGYVPGSISPPVAVVIPGNPGESGRAADAIAYDSTMANGSHDYRFSIKVLVGTVVDESAQARLDEYVATEGIRSIKAAVEADMSLGGVASWARVSSVTHYGIVPWGGVDYLGADLRVEVTA